MAELTQTHNTETMIEEYMYCRTVARELQGNILRTATLFGIGSVAAIGIVTQGFGLKSVGSGPAQGDSFIGVALVSVLALAGWFTWWRMAERWRSIAYVMIIRMEHLE